MKLIKVSSDKQMDEVIEEIKKEAANFDFIIREIFNMANNFKEHGVEVSKDFKFYSIMLCNPQKAYESINKKPLRGALLLPPKQVVIYPDKENKKTIISYVAIEEKDVKDLYPEDNKFQEGLSISCKKIIELIKRVQ